MNKRLEVETYDVSKWKFLTLGELYLQTIYAMLFSCKTVREMDLGRFLFGPNCSSGRIFYYRKRLAKRGLIKFQKARTEKSTIWTYTHRTGSAFLLDLPMEFSQQGRFPAASIERHNLNLARLALGYYSAQDYYETLKKFQNMPWLPVEPKCLGSRDYKFKVPDAEVMPALDPSILSIEWDEGSKRKKAIEKDLSNYAREHNYFSGSVCPAILYVASTKERADRIRQIYQKSSIFVRSSLKGFFVADLPTYGRVLGEALRYGKMIKNAPSLRSHRMPIL